MMAVCGVFNFRRRGSIDENRVFRDSCIVDTMIGV